MSYVKKLLFIAFLYGGLSIGAMDEWQGYAFRGNMLSNQVADVSLALDKGDYTYFSCEVVFVVEADGIKNGIIIDRTSSGDYKIQFNNSDETRVVDKENIRKLSLLGHMLYQPNVSCEVLRSTIDHYLQMLPPVTCPFVQSCILSPEKKIVVVGDLHGCFDSLAYYFKEWYEKGIITKNFVLNPEYIIIFTGDYIDRGQNCIEVLYALMTLKITNPCSVFLIQGNHEQKSMIESGDFYDEWLVEFGEEEFEEETWSRLLRTFYSMPNAVVVGRKIQSLYDCILFSHGGIEDIPNFLGCIIGRHVAHTIPYAIMNHTLEGLREYNGFSWLDFYAQGPTNPALICKSCRGERLFALSWQCLFDYLQRKQSSVDPSKPYSYILRALCRGHQHMEGGITQLLQREDTHGQNWRPLTDKQEYPIQRGDVFTFFSASDILPSAYSKHYAYGIISMKNDQWVLIPYIKEWFWTRALPH